MTADACPRAAGWGVRCARVCISLLLLLLLLLLLVLLLLLLLLFLPWLLRILLLTTTLTITVHYHYSLYCQLPLLLLHLMTEDDASPRAAGLGVRCSRVWCAGVLLEDVRM